MRPERIRASVARPKASAHGWAELIQRNFILRSGVRPRTCVPAPKRTASPPVTHTLQHPTAALAQRLAFFASLPGRWVSMALAMM